MKQFSHLDDASLQTLAAKGDAQAEEALIGRFSNLVRRCARPLFLAGGDGEDLTQEGMMGLLSALRTYRPELGASFQTYAETCIRRRLLTAVKSASRYKHSPLNDAISLEAFLFEEGEVRDGLPARDMEEQILAQERADEMWNRFAVELSSFEHRVLVLFLAGLSYLEIAQHTGKTVKSVDNAVQRIRKKLAQYAKSPGEISPGCRNKCP